jgi:hypothetical protein
VEGRVELLALRLDRLDAELRQGLLEVASTPSIRFDSAGSAARASLGTAAMARFRLSPTVSMSRAKLETA